MSSLYDCFPNSPKDYSHRYKKLYIVLAIGAIIITSRLWYLQVITGKEFRQFSKKNSVKENFIAAPRGLIFDRNMKVLVKNRLSYSLTISPQYAKKLHQTAKEIEPIINIPAEKIIQKVKTSRYKNGSFRHLTIKEHLSLDQILKLKLLHLNHPGIYIKDTIVRHYPLGENGSQLLGYIGQISKKQLLQYNKKFSQKSYFRPRDIVGKSGLELAWDKQLLGANGMQLVEVDAKGRKTFENKAEFIKTSRIEPTLGNNLVLTIDSDIQKATYKAMQRKDKYGQRIGAIISMKTNGEILSWVSSPSFNANKFTTRLSNELWNSLINDPFLPLRNKVIQDPVPPGSTFKPFLALAALQEKIITAEKKIHSPGTLKYGRRTYHDSHIEGHGNINVAQAIERSSNIFFYKMGISLGIDRIAKYAKLFGFGKKTGIFLRGERAGLIPNKEWKLKHFNQKWLPGETLSSAIGQGFVLTTPLQLAKAYNAIALDGKVYRPFLVKQITNPQKKVITEFQPVLESDISDPKQEPFIEKSHFATVKKGLKQVFHGKNGTARWLKIPNLKMSGKTGTVQMQSFSYKELYLPCIRRPLNKRHHALFVGYAPSENPQITVAIFAERGCSGPGAAAPLFREVVKAYMKKYHPKSLELNKKVLTSPQKTSQVTP